MVAITLWPQNLRPIYQRSRYDKEKNLNFLTHAAITDIVRRTGKLDVARAAAGQKSISVTQGYNHADVLIAVEQAVERSKDVD